MRLTNQVVARLRKDCGYNSTRTLKDLFAAFRSEIWELERAIAGGADWEIEDELGDVLFCFLSLAAALAEAHGVLLDDADRHAAAKMTNRHPYVFADEPDPGPTLGSITWEAEKRREEETRLKRRVAVVGTCLAKVSDLERRPQLPARLIEALLAKLGPFDADNRPTAQTRSTEDGRFVSIRTFPSTAAMLVEFVGGPHTAAGPIQETISGLTGGTAVTHLREATK